MNLRILLGAPLLTLTLLLGACTGMAPAPVQPPAEDGHARALMHSGDLAGAAAEYKRLAATTPSPLRESYLVEAADLMRQTGLLGDAEALLQGIAADRLPAPVLVRYRLALAAVQVEREQNAEALATLEGLERTPLDLDQQQRLYRLRITALERSSQYGEAARQRAALDLLLTDPEPQLANQQALWADLGQLSREELRTLHTQPPPDIFSGWLELALIERIFARSPQQKTGAMEIWHGRFPNHPAAQVLLAEQKAVGPATTPDHIAVLLPLSGQLAPVGQTVREGFLAAFYARGGGDTPVITFYDTATMDVGQAYNNAITAGAQFVVGPLTKENLSRLVAGTPLMVPTLALNRLDDGTQPAANTGGLLYQFGLAPEDDAREVARHAWLMGHRQMIALVPEGAWGERLVQAFASEWHDLGGKLLQTGTFASDNVANTVSTLLHIGQSEERKNRLTRTLGRRLEFEPHRRQDADAVFVGAFPREARQIRPLLSFYYANDLPVYATSHVFSGQPNPTADQDMDGIEFCDLPWMVTPSEKDQALKATNETLWPGNSERYTRLFALGMDAYDVIPELQRLSQGPGYSFPGHTGDLSLTPNGLLRRALSWARFDQGLPVPAAPPPASAEDALSFTTSNEEQTNP